MDEGGDDLHGVQLGQSVMHVGVRESIEGGARGDA